MVANMLSSLPDMIFIRFKAEICFFLNLDFTVTVSLFIVFDFWYGHFSFFLGQRKSGLFTNTVEISAAHTQFRGH